MPLVRCPHCQALMQVEATEELDAYVCMLCGRSLDPPRQDEDEAVEDIRVEPAIDRPHRTEEIQDFVDRVEEQARREEQERRKPYKKQARPVGPILGYSLIVGGVLLMFGTFFFSGGMMNTLINGILFPIIMILVGVICLLGR